MITVATCTTPEEAHLSLLVFHIPWPFIRRRWQCRDCGKRFKLIA